MSEQKQKLKECEKEHKRLKKELAEMEKVMDWLLNDPSSVECYLKAYKFYHANQK